MKAIERLFQYFDYKHIKPTRFEKDYGLSNGYFGGQLKREADIGSSILAKIVDNCRDLSIEWLITGKGDMLVEKSSELPQFQEKEVNYTKSQVNCEKCRSKDELIASLRREIQTQAKLIDHLENKSSGNGKEVSRKDIA